MKKTIAALTLTLLVLLAGCRAKKAVRIDPGERGSDKTMYENAMKYMNKDPEKARLLFKEIGQLYPDSIYANKAKLGIADAYYKERDSASLIMAAAEYQEYVNLYPYAPDAVYAKYQIGMCYYKQMKKAERDQTNTFAAIKGFEGVIQQYPGTPEADEAKKKIDECRQVLARHYFLIGYYNYLMKAYPGAIARFKQVMDEYPDFQSNDRLFYYTGKTYAATQDYESALSFFRRVIGSHAKSKYARKAQRQLKKIEQRLAESKNRSGGAEK
ncbi:MAG: outer membrane protein assembly factor BamD [Candidatus Aminicenantes bacterium]|nr:outer membrane protein assembly factor BamD [Candidatus Aminicenantes bacterium]